MLQRRPPPECRVVAFFRDIANSEPWWQRTALEIVAKAARENPDARGYDLLDCMEQVLETVNAILKGDEPNV